MKTAYRSNHPDVLASEIHAAIEAVDEAREKAS